MLNLKIRKLKTQLVKERAEKNKLYDDCYPEVGMGKNWIIYVDEAIIQLNYTKEEINYSLLINNGRVA